MATEPTAAGPGAAEDSVARNTLFSFLTQMTTAAGTAVLTLYLVRALGPRDWGLFSLAIGVGTLVLIPSDFGVTHSAARFIAEKRGDLRAVSAVLADAWRVKLALGAAVAALLVALAGPIAAAYGEPALAWPIRWVSIAVLGQSMMQLYRYAFGSLRRLSVGWRIVASESAAETGASIALVILAGGAAGAAAGRAIGYGAGFLVAVALTLRALGRSAFLSRETERGVARRSLVRYAGALLIIDSAFTLSSQIAPLMIGGFLGARAVGVFQAPAKLIVFLQYPGLSVANSVGPGLARREGHEPDVRSFLGALRAIVVFQCLTLAPVVVWARPIMDLLLGPGYGQSASVLRALAPFVFFSGLAALVSLAVNYLGEARLRVPIALGDLALDLVLTAVLLQAIGLTGAAIAADVTSLVYVAAHLWICTRAVGLRLRPLALTTARALLAAAAMAAVLYAFGTRRLSIPEWIGGALLGPAAFAAVVLATRELAPAELRSLAGAVRRRLRRA